MQITCPSCTHSNAKILFDYKYNVEWDRRLLEADKICRCESCHLVFAWPRPKIENLSEYYTNYYRANGRPHWVKQPPRPTYRHLAYVSYLTHHVDLSQTRSIYEIGAGWGEIGLLLKKLYPHLIIRTTEPDKFVRKNLTARGYIVVDANDAEPDYDVILSFHTLEHFTNPKDFFNLTKRLKKGGHLMLEVPNCDFEAGWEKRVYDSPHLLFFTMSSLVWTAENHGFRKVFSHTTGQSIDRIINLESQSKAIHGEWTPERPKRKLSATAAMLSFFADAMPESLVRLVRKLVIPDQDSSIENFSTEFDLSRKDGWVIRGLFRKV